MPTEFEHKETEDYLNLLLETTRADEVDLGKLKIVVDASNGPVANVLNKLFSKININAFPVNFDGDPALTELFPDVFGPESFPDLRHKVIELRADLGVAFDPEGERLGLVDDTARVVLPEYILQLLYQATDAAHDPGISGDSTGRFYFKEMGEQPQPILAMLRIITSLSKAYVPISKIVKHIKK